ncbi:MAG: hypothetical protein NVSMB2_08430 [Chloroflexota bacterium]
MIDLNAAFERLMDVASPLSVEEVPLESAVGRVAARDVSATGMVPRFRRAMMDGYVCFAADVVPVELTRRYGERVPVRQRPMSAHVAAADEDVRAEELLVGAGELVHLACATLTQAGRPIPQLVVVEGFSSSALPRVEVGAQKKPVLSEGWVLARLAERFSDNDVDTLADVVSALLAQPTVGAKSTGHAPQAQWVDVDTHESRR